MKKTQKKYEKYRILNRRWVTFSFLFLKKFHIFVEKNKHQWYNTN